jgi:hypothetical protein
MTDRITECLSVCGTVDGQRISRKKRDIRSEQQYSLARELNLFFSLSKSIRTLTFMPRLVRNVPQDLQSKIQTLCAICGGGGGAKETC